MCAEPQRQVTDVTRKWTYCETTRSGTGYRWTLERIQYPFSDNFSDTGPWELEIGLISLAVILFPTRLSIKYPRQEFIGEVTTPFVTMVYKNPSFGFSPRNSPSHCPLPRCRVPYPSARFEQAFVAAHRRKASIPPCPLDRTQTGCSRLPGMSAGCRRNGLRFGICPPNVLPLIPVGMASPPLDRPPRLPDYPPAPTAVIQC